MIRNVACNCSQDSCCKYDGDVYKRQVQDYLYEFNAIRGSFITIANEGWWNGLDQKVRDAITESLSVGEAYYEELRLAREEEALNTMAQYLEIITLTDEQENKLKDLAQPGCQELYICLLYTSSCV